MLPPQGLSRPPGTACNPSRLPRARGERKLFLQQHCPARTRLLRDCPAAGRIPTDFLCRRLSSWLGLTCRGCRQRGIVSPIEGWCEHHPAHPAVGTGWHRRGREQAPAWGGWSQECLVPVSPVFRQCFGYKKLKGQGRWVVSQLLCRRGDKAGPGGASHSLSQKDPMLGTVHNSPH